METKLIQSLAEKVLGKIPDEIIRKTIGICNEVYELKYDEGEYILRMNAQKNLLYGTHKFLPIFKDLAIATPEIIAEDYSQTKFPFCYQILTKIAGEDLLLAMNKLNAAQLKGIAAEVSNIFDKFKSLPPKRDFGGLTGMSEESISNMLEVVQGQRNGIWENSRESKVLEPKFFDILDKLISEHEEYFLHLKPRLYYDDMSSKNVMIHNGKFAGLVDLDFLRKGDYIEVLGATKAVWHGVELGQIYLDEIIRLQALNESQQKLVNLYAIIHLMMWTSEAGRKFNDNTSGLINWENVERNKAKILAIYQEIEA